MKAVTGKSVVWDDACLHLPPFIPESRLPLSDMIDVSYLLQFDVHLSRKAEVKLHVPVVIGTNLPEGGGERSRIESKRNTATDQRLISTKDVDAKRDASVNTLRDAKHPWEAKDASAEHNGENIAVNNPLFQYQQTHRKYH